MSIITELQTYRQILEGNQIGFTTQKNGCIAAIEYWSKVISELKQDTPLYTRKMETAERQLEFHKRELEKLMDN